MPSVEGKRPLLLSARGLLRVVSFSVQMRRTGTEIAPQVTQQNVAILIERQMNMTRRLAEISSGITYTEITLSRIALHELSGRITIFRHK